MKSPFVSQKTPSLIRFLTTSIIVASCAPAPMARATPPGHNISAGNVTVVQNDTGNLVTSVTTFTSLSINDFRVRGTNTGSDTNTPFNSRADYCVQIGSEAGDDFTNGMLMSSVTQNGRDNGEGNGINYGTSMIENQRTNLSATNIIGAYLVCTHGNTNGPNAGAGNIPEYNFNFAAAWFPYSEFIGGLARNHGPNDELGQGAAGGFTNGGALNQLIGSPGLAIGTHFFDLGSGKSFLVLTNPPFGIDSRTDGILLVNGGKNETANFGLAQVNTTNGGWNLFIKDQGNNGSSLTSFEQDPIAFVYIPKTNTTIISGRFLGDASIAMFSGASPQFTVTSAGVGTYELKVIGYSPTNGVLIVSPGGGEAINLDNWVHYELNGANDGWIIQSRDAAPAALESPGATETVATFAFIPGPTPGFTVSPTNNLNTTEAGGTAMFTVVLHKQPTANVTIGVSSSNTGEGTVSPSSLTFTATDWNVPQAVTITGQNDPVTDGNIAYTINLAPAVSTDPNWNGLDPDNVSVVNIDNDTPGVTVAPLSGLITTEGGGQATVNIHLNTQPTADVTIGLSSSDTTEGTVFPASVTFNSSNWNMDQPVTITGVDDFVDDGDIAYTLITAAASSADGNYNNLTVADASVSNADNDTAGITTSVGLNVVSIVEGQTGGYTVVLDSQPTANVTVNVVSGNTSQGGTVSPSSLTFTPLNWSNAQPVTITAADDLVIDGSTSYGITNTAGSTDPLYAALAPVLTLATTLDNEGVLTLPSGDLIYGIGQAGIGIDGRATLVDPNTPNYNGGNLTVTLTANGTSDDRVEVRNTGTGAGQIGVSGSTVSYGGTTIGSFSGGTGVTPLVIALNSSATPAAAEALARNVTFRNVNSNPSLNRRSVSFVLTDGDTSSTTATTGVRVGLLRATSFQESTDHGYGVYTGEADCHLRQADPSTPYPAGSGGGLFIDWPDAGMQNAFQVLMRFDNIMGDAFGQVPSNAVIVSADLILRIPPEDSNSMGDASPLYRMLIPWNESTETWTSMGNGVDQDDIESRSTADSEFGLSDGSGNTDTGTISFSVRPDVQTWQGAAANYGWVMPGWIGRTDGTTISPGEATNTFDRPHLRVKWLPPGVSVSSFRQGVNGYTDAVDTEVRGSSPTSSFENATSIGPDWTVNTAGDNRTVLMRFDNIFGTANPNQVPPGSRVHAAILELASRGNLNQGHGGHFHAMLQSWQSTSTWDGLVNGIQTDDAEAASTISAMAGSAALTPFAQGGFNAFELTDDVEAWSTGVRPNYGWAILPWTNGGDGWFFASAENGTASNRPELRVYFTPSLVIRSITRGPTSTTIQFIGPPNTSCTVLRATTVTGTYSSIGQATIQPDGTATFTDNSPPATQAYYRVRIP